MNLMCVLNEVYISGGPWPTAIINESAPSGVKIYSIERSAVLPTIFNAFFVSLYYVVDAIYSLLCIIF